MHWIRQTYSSRLHLYNSLSPYFCYMPNMIHSQYLNLPVYPFHSPQYFFQQTYIQLHSFIHSKHLRNSQSHNPLILTAMVQNGFYTQNTSHFLPQTSFHWNFDLRFHSLDCSVSISLNLQFDWFTTATGHIATELAQINIRFLGYWTEHDHTITIKYSVPSKHAFFIHCAKSAKRRQNNLRMNLGNWTWRMCHLIDRTHRLLLYHFLILLDFLKCFKCQLFQRTSKFLIIRSQNSKFMP